MDDARDYEKMLGHYFMRRRKWRLGRAKNHGREKQQQNIHFTLDGKKMKIGLQYKIILN